MHADSWQTKLIYDVDICQTIRQSPLDTVEP